MSSDKELENSDDERSKSPEIERQPPQKRSARQRTIPPKFKDVDIEEVSRGDPSSKSVIPNCYYYHSCAS